MSHIYIDNLPDIGKVLIYRHSIIFPVIFANYLQNLDLPTKRRNSRHKSVSKMRKICSKRFKVVILRRQKG